MGQLLVSVSDFSIGLPVGEVDRIFEAFFTTKSRARHRTVHQSEDYRSTEAVCGLCDTNGARISVHTAPPTCGVLHRRVILGPSMFLFVRRENSRAIRLNPTNEPSEKAPVQGK